MKARLKMRKNTITKTLTNDKVYIDYLNKKNGYKLERIKFNSYAKAVTWGKKNLEKFNYDIINYESKT